MCNDFDSKCTIKYWQTISSSLKLTRSGSISMEKIIIIE